MKFKFGARARSGQYTVRASHAIMDPITKRVEHTKPIRVHFKEHTWDSEVAQKEFRWSDEERQEAENYLLNHPDFGKVDGRGIFIDQTRAQMPQAEYEAIMANRDMNKMKRALAGEPNDGVVEMARQLMDQAQALLKQAGVDFSDQPDVQPAETTIETPQQVCIQFVVAGDDSIQCGNPVEDGKDFCETCQREIDEEEAKRKKAAEDAAKEKKKAEAAAKKAKKDAADKEAKELAEAGAST